MSEETHARIAALENEIRAAQAELAELLKQEARTPVDDVVLQGPDGPVRLSELFGDQPDLILSFNMGRSCPYCTLWADEVSGVVHHLQRRASFYVISPDAPADQRAFAESRGWRFPMVSHTGTSFAADMGFAEEQDGRTFYAPGVVTFHKHDDGHIERVARRYYGPGDPFCGVWHFFDLLEGGAGDFQPEI